MRYLVRNNYGYEYFTGKTNRIYKYLIYYLIYKCNLTLLGYLGEFQE